MTVAWLQDLNGLVSDHGIVVRVTVIEADGSAPRDVGAFMNVTGTSFEGTVGGGALENEALAVSRQILNENHTGEWRRQVRDYPLGPDLAQCCGGYVRLLYETFGVAEIKTLNVAVDDPSHAVAVRPVVSGCPIQIIADRKTVAVDWPLALRRDVRDMMSGIKPCRAGLTEDGWFIEPLGAKLTPLYLYGAGHVGRAVVQVLKDLPFLIHWVDTRGDRFPEVIPEGIRQVINEAPATVPDEASAGAFHVVMTFSHIIDFDICRAVLARGNFSYLGLIGSKTKRARFAKRLRDDGLGDAWIERLHSPIGVPGLEGKEPAIIAISLAADLLVRLNDCARSIEGNFDVIEGGAL